MTSRTRQSIVHVSFAFELPGFDQPLAEADEHFDYGEEQIARFSGQARRQGDAFSHLGAISMLDPVRQMVPINSTDLDAVHNKHREQS